MNEQAPVTLNFLFGFLGAGKTTLVQRILACGRRDEKLAIIVNEFGEVGIDGAILSGSSIDMIELTSGCLCCTLRGSLMNAIEELSTKLGATRIVIEATGVAQPHDLIGAFDYPRLRSRYRLAPVVTVVDSSKFTKLLAGLGNFYRAQLESADTIILNKIDIASASALAQAKSGITQINPRAQIHFAERCEIDPDVLLHAQPDARHHAADCAHHEDHGPAGTPAHAGEHFHDQLGLVAESFALDASGESTLDAVSAFFRTLPDSVWRAKGYMRIDGRLQLIQYSMGDLQLGPTDDRAIYSMVFIGRQMQRSELAARFRTILTQPER